MSFHLSNSLLGLVNFLTFLFSIPIIVGGIWLRKHGATECALKPDSTLIIIGVLIMIISLAGFIGTCCKVRWLLWVYLVILLILILLGLGFTFFTLAVSNKGSGEKLPGKGYKEYKLEKYSNWIQNIMNKTENWNKFKSCMIDSKVCTDFKNKYLNDSVEKFYKERLNAIQSGCCKPPNDCGFTYKSPTNWTEEKAVYSNPDCKAWGNDPKVLCFNCKSCKGGVADNVKHSLKIEATVNAAFLVLLIIVYFIGCCAFRNIKEDNPYNNQEWKA